MLKKRERAPHKEQYKASRILLLLKLDHLNNGSIGVAK